ncbi:MAG TPA: S8 family serine peptidase [Polyangiales bacterium]|nr:S8 family serine peptidase [Polyangiales bacterium]
MRESPADRVEQYRNGSDWLRVERTGTASSGRTALVLEGGGHLFHAEIDGHAIVQVAKADEVSSLLRREQLQLVRPLSAAARLYLVEARVRGTEDGLQIAARLATAAGFVEAIPDLYLPRVRHGIQIPPDDPHYKGQWYLKKIGIEKAWKLSTGDADTKVVVVDDGCDLQHPDLRDKFQGGRDVLDQDDDPSYQPGVKNNAHGTACAGLVGAKTDNGEGMAGVCPECSLLCVRLLSGRDDRAVPVSADIAAFDFSLQQGASVVSNSWGFSETLPAPAPLRAVLEMLHDEGRDGLGTLVVFAAGNENRLIQSNEVAAVRGVLTVGAINNFDEAAPFSNYGASLGVTAPAGTFSTDISGPEGMDDGDYTDSFGGTSSACPVLAGVAGLVMSARKDMSAADALELLEKTTRAAPYAEPDSRGHDKTYGFGIVDPAAALRMALGVKEEPDADMTASTADDSGGCAVTTARADAVMLLGFLLSLWSLLRRRHAR